MFLPDYDPTKNRGRFAIVPLDLLIDPNVSDGAVRLYGYVAAMNLAHSDPIRREQIAGDLTITPTSVTNRVKELVARDWLIAWKHFANDLHSNAYQTFNNTDECRDYRANHTNVRYVDFEGEMERRKIRRGNRAASIQIDDPSRLMIHPDGLTQQGQDQSSLTDHDQTGLTPYLESDSSIQTPDSIDSPSTKDSVADATLSPTLTEEVDLMPNNAAPQSPNPPSTPSSALPLPPQTGGVPEGYELRYASGGSGKTAHMVKIGAADTVCNKSIGTLLSEPKEGRSYSMCPLCMAKRNPAPRVDQPIRDAVAQHVQGFAPEMATEFTGVLASVAIAVWMRKLDRKLVEPEYPKVARSINAFADDWRRRNPGREMQTGKTAFENNFTKFVSSAKPEQSEAPATEPTPDSQIISTPGLFAQYGIKTGGDQ